MQSENPYGWRKANGKRLKTLNFSSPLSRGAGRGSFSLLAAAARYSHARRKILPRPLQDIRTGGANLLHAVSLPFLPRCFTFSTLGFSPLLPRVLPFPYLRLSCELPANYLRTVHNFSASQFSTLSSLPLWEGPGVGRQLSTIYCSL